MKLTQKGTPFRLILGLEYTGIVWRRGFKRCHLWPLRMALKTVESMLG